jgi:leucyl-tRNA synthetase
MLKFDEPFTRLLNQGMINLGGTKMSKSKGNIVEPKEITNKYGADTARLFILFAALPEKELEWSDKGVEASNKFIKKIIKMCEKTKYSDKIPGTLTSKEKSIIGRVHRTIKKVTEQIQKYEFNLAIRSIMGLTNHLNRARIDIKKQVYDYAITRILILLSPVTPHICEELWEKIGGKGFISITKWPKFDKDLINEKAEVLDEVLSTVISDINEIIKLVKKKPKRITLLISESWKYKLADIIRKADDKRDFKSIIKKAMTVKEIKEHGKEATKIVQAVANDVSKLLPVKISQKDELAFFSESEEFIEREFECPVETIKAEDSDEAKARAALPGKPGILIE